MMKFNRIRFWLFSFTIVFSLILSSWTKKSSNEEFIPWESGRKLTWNDFRGKPDNSSSYYASTAYAVECETELRMDSMFINVKCFMRPEFSWVKSDGQKETLLQHEQLHFDIAELFTRKLRKEFNAASFTLKSAEKTYRSISERNSREREAEQNRYDKETRHSMNEEKQAEWNKKIAGELADLEEFSGSKVRVALKGR